VALRALQLPAKKQPRRDRRRRDGHFVQMAGEKNDGTVLVAAPLSCEQLFDELIVRDVCVDRVSQPAVQRRSPTASIIRPPDKQVAPDARRVADVVLVVEQLINETFPLVACFGFEKYCQL
jgi:hypothetical protein